MMQGPAQDRVLLVRALFPQLAADLDAALAEHGDPNPDADFDAWLDARASEVRAASGLEDIADAGAAARMRHAFAASRMLAVLVGAESPEPEAFLAAGIDLPHLEQRLLADEALVPVIAPHGLGPDAWVTAFASEEAERTALVIAREALREFSALDAAPEEAVSVIRGPIVWTLRLIPAGAKPSVLGLGFAHGPHPTLPEMLSLQFMRLLDAEPPIDASSFTWLAGPLAEGRLAARHVYDASERTVRITCREVGSQGPHLGARPPVW